MWLHFACFPADSVFYTALYPAQAWFWTMQPLTSNAGCFLKKLKGYFINQISLLPPPLPASSKNGKHLSCNWTTCQLLGEKQIQQEFRLSPKGEGMNPIAMILPGQVDGSLQLDNFTFESCFMICLFLGRGSEKKTNFLTLGVGCKSVWKATPVQTEKAV